MEKISVAGDFAVGTVVTITGTVTKAGSPATSGLCEVEVESVEGEGGDERGDDDAAPAEFAPELIEGE